MWTKMNVYVQNNVKVHKIITYLVNNHVHLAIIVFGNLLGYALFRYTYCQIFNNFLEIGIRDLCYEFLSLFCSSLCLLIFFICQFSDA